MGPLGRALSSLVSALVAGLALVAPLAVALVARLPFVPGAAAAVALIPRLAFVARVAGQRRARRGKGEQHADKNRQHSSLHFTPPSHDAPEDQDARPRPEKGNPWTR